MEGDHKPSPSTALADPRGSETCLTARSGSFKQVAAELLAAADREERGGSETESVAQPAHPLSIRQQAATCSALSASRESARSTNVTTRSSAIRL